VAGLLVDQGGGFRAWSGALPLAQRLRNFLCPTSEIDASGKFQILGYSREPPP